MFKKLFASDLDCTLLNRRHEVDDVIASGIKKLRANDVLVVPATGRSMSMCHQLGLDTAPFVGSNGAIVYGPDGNVIASHPIRKEYLKELWETFPDMPFEFCGMEKIYSRQGREQSVASFLERWQRRGRPKRVMDFDRMFASHVHNASLDDVLSEDIYKINCNNNGDENAQKFEKWVEKHPDLVNAPSDSVLFEVTDRLATKGEGVATLAKALGISDENVSVFGDGINDVSMLERFSNSYAPDAGSVQARAAANHLLDASDEHCVIHEMERIGLPKKVFFSDLDGTLLTPMSQLDEKTREVMDHVEKNGGHVIVCTGRHPLMCHTLKLPKGWGIFCNGAIILDDEGRVAHSYVIPENDIMDLLRTFGTWPMAFLSADGMFCNKSPMAFFASMRRQMRHKKHHLIQIGGFRKNLADMKFNVSAGKISRLPIVKVEMRPQSEKDARKLHDWLAKHPNLVSAPSVSGLEEITVRDADKGNAAKFVCEKLGVDFDEVSVFGDGRNDVPLLVAFADSYAPDTGAKEAADAAHTLLEMSDPLAVTHKIEELFNN